jgi:hypothetical protein
MDWNAVFENLRNASTLYWVAAAAIAAGVTLLTTAFVLHLRRRPPRARRDRRPVGTAPPAAVPVPGGYTPAAAARPANLRAPDLAPVTARLAAAAARLAAVRAELDDIPVVPPAEVLKESPSHVEYVFRTSEA